jgi:hypothetical protein
MLTWTNKASHTKTTARHKIPASQPHIITTPTKKTKSLLTLKEMDPHLTLNQRSWSDPWYENLNATVTVASLNPSRKQSSQPPTQKSVLLHWHNTTTNIKRKNFYPISPDFPGKISTTWFGTLILNDRLSELSLSWFLYLTTCVYSINVVVYVRVLVDFPISSIVLALIFVLCDLRINQLET